MGSLGEALKNVLEAPVDGDKNLQMIKKDGLIPSHVWLEEFFSYNDTNYGGDGQYTKFLVAGVGGVKKQVYDTNKNGGSMSVQLFCDKLLNGKKTFKCEKDKSEKEIKEVGMGYRGSKDWCYCSVKVKVQLYGLTHFQSIH